LERFESIVPPALGQLVSATQRWKRWAKAFGPSGLDMARQRAVVRIGYGQYHRASSNHPQKQIGPGRVP